MKLSRYSRGNSLKVNTTVLSIGIGGEPVSTKDDSRFEGGFEAWHSLDRSAWNFLKGSQ